MEDASRRYRRLLGMALERKNPNSNSQASRKTNLRSGTNEAEALAVMEKEEGAATGSHSYPGR